ncbi:MAG TPA: DUF423 domain-containing protein [Chitinophagaceae bacterium]|nr:DUF423 domain-containing protein [Chitinophagaceae bacterium]
MHNRYIAIAAVIGALTVATGAFGAHALKDNLSPDAMQIFDTAVKYQFYHLLALLAAGILYSLQPGSLLSLAAKLFIAGMVLFCGSLYALAAIVNSGNESLKWVGAVTPLGGVSFIAGWLCFAAAAFKKRQ